MAGSRAFHLKKASRYAGASARLRDRVELTLFLVAVCVVLFVAGTWARNAATQPTPPVTATVSVKAGDTLWSLAKEYGDPERYILERVNALIETNGHKRAQALHEGQTLVIPVSNRSAELYYGGRYATREVTH